MKKILALTAFVFALAVAMPTYAEETASTTGSSTAVTTTQAAASSSDTTAPKGDWAKNNKSLIEKYRALLTQKRAAGEVGNASGKSMRYANASSTCIQKAVDAREVLVVASWTKLASSITTALSTRQKALFDAWGLEDGTNRGVKIKAAWDAWKKSHRDAFKTLKTDRDSAWKAFRTTVREECRIALPAAETSGTDGTGSLAL